MAAPDPEVLPVVQTLGGPVVVDVPTPAPSAEAFAAEPMTKWAGQPSESAGLAGQISKPSDQTYDPSRKPSPFTEVGASGLAQYGGFVRDEFLLQLQGDKGLKTYREMYDNDAIVGALVFAIQMLLRKVEWRVEPAEGGSVEDVVERRIQERMQAQQEKQQQQQLQLQQAQAGLAQNAQAGSSRQPGGPPGGAPGAPRMPQSPRAAAINKPGPLNAPLQKRIAIGDRFNKASGGMAGGISISDVPETTPIDPETNEPMEDLVTDITDPQARHAEELAVFVESCFHDMDNPWAEVLAEIITMIVFGFAFHEIVYKKRTGPNPDDPDKGSQYDDGKIGWGKLAGRAQETRHRWEFDNNGNVIGMWQLAPPKFQLRYIPMQKALLFRTTAYKGNPEGRSVFRSAYRSWYFKRRIEEFEAIGVERDLAGLPIAYVPYQMMTVDATNEEKAALDEIKKIVRNIRHNTQEGVVFPMAIDPDTKQELYKLELLASPSRRQFDTDKIIGRYEQRIAMTSLADFILLGHEGVGARSMTETKTDLFTTALESFLNIIADVFNTYAIPRLLQLNGEDLSLCPRLTFGKLGRINLTDLSALITALSGAGADLFPDRPLEDFVRQAGGLPPKQSSTDL